MFVIVANILKRIIPALKAVIPLFLAFMAGRYKERSKIYERALKDAEEYNRLRRDVRHMSRSERLRVLREQGMLRDVPADKPDDNG